MTSTLAAKSRVSRTAYDCAAVRATVFASTGLRSFDYLAADIVRSGSASAYARIGVTLLRLGAAGLVRKIISRTSPGSDVFLFARQTVPDDMIRSSLLRDPETQAVILGAGLDTCGLRIGAERRAAGMAPGRFFEVDLPEMQTEKREVTQKLLNSAKLLDDRNILYVPCSFGEDELASALEGAGFDRTVPTIWVWSGVIHYLSEHAIQRTIATVKSLSTVGSRIFFDFILLEAYERPDDYRFSYTKDRFDSFGEVMSFGLHKGTDHVRDWLKGMGLELIRCYSNLDMVELYEQKTGEPAPSQGTPSANLCIAAF